MVHPALAISMLIAAPFSQQTFSQAQTETAIAHYFHQSHANLPKKYFSKTIPAYGKSPSIMVLYLYGSSDWCGSSGCEVLVLEMGQNGPRVVSEVNAWPPITLDGRSRSGYPLIGVWHHGGGQLKPYCEELKFGFSDIKNSKNTKQEQNAEHLRCLYSKNILFSLPKNKSNNR
jgi:hypothetical protein